MFVAGFDLRQNLRLAKHQGVQAGAHLEEVLRGRLAGVREEVRLQLVSSEPGLLPQEGVHTFYARVLLQLRRGEVEFKTVAGREHGYLGYHVAVRGPGKLHEFLRVAVPIRLRHRQLLPNLNGSFVVAKADDMHLHHGLDLVRGLGVVCIDGLRGNRLDLVAGHLQRLEVLAQLTGADLQGRLAEAVDGVDEGAQQLIHLAEDAAELRLPELLHRLDDVPELPTAQQLCLVLQSGDLRHKLGNGALDTVGITAHEGR
mmetsp:Transcript_82940/g.268335  ORF Transcript_82940/g.268335 Transcript_82940/m.268335 type:complete len:257 (-) Transcript_82940:394-1164(-)